MPSFVSFIGFDWFEILKRVGFCGILYVCAMEVGEGVCVSPCRRVVVFGGWGGGGYFLYIFACLIDGRCGLTVWSVE